MKLSEEKVRALIQQGENDSVEFKVSLPDASALAQNISALANTHGGTLFVGIEESGKIAGTSPEQIIQLVEKAKELLTPTLDLDVSTLVIDHKPVVMISVPKTQQVVFSNGMALKRVGEQIRRLSAQDILSKVTTPINTIEIKGLAEAITKQTEIIGELREELRAANSFLSKLKDYVIGGIIGAILGAVATILMR